MPLRCVFLQPSLPKYRVPVFKELATRAGIEVRVCYGELPSIPNAKPDGFEATYVPYYSWRFPGGGFEWHWPPASLLSSNACDVLCLSWNLRFLSLPPALARARMHRVPTVLWGHGYSKHDANWKKRLRVSLVRLADTAVVYNYGVADAIVAAGLSRDRVFVALNTVDQPPIAAAKQSWLERPAELAAFKDANRLSKGPNLLFVSRLEKSNRTELLLEAAVLLRNRYPAVRVMIVGSGPDLGRLEALVAKHNLSSAVTFTGAVYDEKQLAPFYISADMFVYPANIGLSLLHAQSYGLPVVTGDRIDQQNPEIEALVPWENGLLFKHGSASALAEAIERLYVDRELHQRMSENASQTASHRYTVPRMVDGLEAAVKSAAMRYSGSRASPMTSMG